MTYFASAGELLLIACLLLSAHRCFHSNDGGIAKPIISFAMLFIAVTASFGVFRFAGVESVITIHDNTSWLSTNLAMPIYACLTAQLFIADKYRLPLFAFLAVTLLLSLTLTTALTNVILFISLLVIAYYGPSRAATIKATLALLAVPLTAFIPVSHDLQMGIFHLFLAAHFYFISDVYQKK